MEVFHGTHWKPGDGLFSLLEPGYSDYGAVWFTDVEDDAEYFAAQYSNPGPEDWPVILRGEIELENPYTWSGEEFIEIPGVAGDEPYEFEVDFGDREELFEMILRMGHDAFIVPDNYPGGGDDIAVLRANTFRVTGVKHQQADETWSDWMSLQAAEDLFLE